MYLQSDTQFLLNNEVIYTMPLYLHHSRSLSHKVTQLMSLCFEKSTDDFSMFWYVVN